jgi:hypothetical protein
MTEKLGRQDARAYEAGVTRRDCSAMDQRQAIKVFVDP